MIKDILDNDGNIIGSLELPDATSNDLWQTQLDLYANPNQLPLQNNITLQVLPSYESNDDAIAAGLTPGQLYNNEGSVCVVYVDNIPDSDDSGG